MPRSDSRLRFLALLTVSFLACFTEAAAQSTVRAGAEQRTAQHFKSLRTQPLELYAFLRKMPKGGDLHLHLSGSVYAESYIEWAAKAKPDLCVDMTTFVLSPCDGTSSRPPASNALTDGVLYRRMIDAWSMRNSELSGLSGHDQFFDAFVKFGAAGNNRYGDMLAELASRAASEGVSYLEVMLTPDNGKSRTAGGASQWPDDDQLAAMSKDELNALFAKKRQELLQTQVDGAAQESRATLDQMEARRRQLLNCDDPNRAGAGCKVSVRYIFQISRAAPHNQTFAQMVAAMETAKADPRLVAMNLVQAEDTRASMNNFALQMAMLDYINRVKESEKDYQKANITLHAGELAPGLVPPEGLRFHIRDSVQKGHAKRIGHAVDVMYEDDPHALLEEMAAKNVMVEVCLTSNDKILGVKGKQHPLPVYLKYGVPVALATDDLGISRSDMTQEYLKAVEDHELSYTQLKGMARASLEHAFIAGKSLWRDAKRSIAVRECERDGAGSDDKNLSPECRRFLEGNEKARLQWELERAYSRFEKGCCQKPGSQASNKP
ncbi:MAG TPA: homocysteine S-methyltransferase family protein [Blastocatellia bacterium]|nr:homocysteine S-methyltransferase family protein [Blastocatellia bacterium]